MANISKQDFMKKLSMIDAKLEVVLAELMERDMIHLNDLVICAKGLFHRSHSNDVIDVEFKSPIKYDKRK